MCSNIEGEFCLENLEQYKKENKAFLENKIVRSFLENEENQQLFINAICNPSNENEGKLDMAFKKYYFNIRFISFVSSALYFNAINFDKKYRKIQSRHPLTVDQPIGGEEDDGTFKELITDENAEIKLEHILKSEDILDYLEEPLLCVAVKALSDKQKEILNLAYLKGLSDTEIGRILNKTQQTVSKTRKKALQNLLNYLREREGN